MSDDHHDEKQRARAWFEELQTSLLSALEALEADAPGPFAHDGLVPGTAATKPWKALQPRWRRWRRRPHGHDQGPRVREGRRALVHRLRHVCTGVRQADPGGIGRPAVLGFRHFGHRASVEPERAGRAHEHALRRHFEKLVWRWRRPHAGARPPPHPGRCRHERLSRRDARRLRGACGRRRLRALQGRGAKSTSS